MTADTTSAGRRPLMRVTVCIDEEAAKEYPGLFSGGFFSEFEPWIDYHSRLDNGEMHLRFLGATHAEELKRNSIRVALVDRDGPQPLIPEADILLCRPMVEKWRPSKKKTER